ncbi:MAG: XisI protein [Jaaginema sp. PMC 1079.18]|nr:XisI protein [Jaaginema sp. PMC 1080.18]MEC4851526.1 XisI protein [Jaaginema sp. PMC 1079.18]MEC4867974.1 XisI protein [Jaaginema sp. PMC 1078.18]
MDNLSEYRHKIKTLLSQYISVEKPPENWESQLIYDEQGEHYLWMKVGWEDSKRIYYSVIHLDIKEGKIWLQKNATDLNPAEDLIELGIPRENIVLGLQPPFKRPYTNYGVA